MSTRRLLDNGDTLLRCGHLLPAGNPWCHCTGCHLTFRGNSAYDKHQMVSGCPDASEGIAAALGQTAHLKRHLVMHTHHRTGVLYWGWNDPR